MTKQNMRKELDIQLSYNLRVSNYYAYFSLLDFAFFSEIVSGTEYKFLLRAFNQ